MNSSNETIVYVGSSNGNNRNGDTKDPFDEIDSIIPRGGVMRPVVTQPTVTTRVIKRNHGDVIVRSVVESVDLDRTLQSFDRSNDLLFAFAFMLLFIGCLGIYGFLMNRLRM
ncbi:hypothetical protein F-liban_484 [Faustovirus]|nr:hypothetical protein F-liban_160 [Faustovirus]QJX71232.1 hypothetical protein F-liban_484 [Faustovirus]